MDSRVEVIFVQSRGLMMGYPETVLPFSRQDLRRWLILLNSERVSLSSVAANALESGSGFSFAIKTSVETLIFKHSAGFVHCASIKQPLISQFTITISRQ